MKNYWLNRKKDCGCRKKSPAEIQQDVIRQALIRKKLKGLK